MIYLLFMFLGGRKKGICRNHGYTYKGYKNKDLVGEEANDKRPC